MNKPKNTSASKNIILKLFVTFFKLGLFTFGGGYAMIPLIEREIVSGTRWVDDKSILDVFALSESVPGSISVNTSMIIGYKVAGYAGAIASLLGVIFPSFFIISLIAAFATQLSGSPIIEAAFLGIRCAVVGLISQSAVKMIKASITDIMGTVLLIVTVILTVFTNVHTVFIIALGAACGLAAPILNTTGSWQHHDIS